MTASSDRHPRRERRFDGDVELGLAMAATVNDTRRSVLML
jgi:hypothetical protein